MWSPSNSMCQCGGPWLYRRSGVRTGASLQRGSEFGRSVPGLTTCRITSFSKSRNGIRTRMRCLWLKLKLQPIRPKAQCQLMAQKMLADRFKMVAHRETRNVAAFAMTVAKGGIKMKPVLPGDEGLGVHIKIDGGEM